MSTSTTGVAERTLRPSSASGRRYRRLGVIGRGATGTVVRAYDRTTARVVAMKTTNAGEGTEDLLAREFELLAGLRHPNIIASLDFGYEAPGRPFFTMDVQEDACSIVEAGRGRPASASVDLLVQLLHALAYLHHRGLYHRDVKPANTLCSGGVLKLIDLGLAVAKGHGEKGAGGTPAYAAPELLRGAPPDERTDLWAVGVIAFELLAGRHPFDTTTQESLLRSIFRTTPSLTDVDLDPALALVVSRLLERDPAKRFSSALDVVDVLTKARETTSTRESLLQSAGLVCRDEELDRLCLALPDAPGRGPGVLLLAGESGVGKSRLLEELALRAMLRGFVVLRGQALREGSRPYEPWRGVIRSLAVLVDPLDKEIAALEAVVPDIAAVLERDVTAAPELDPDAMHVRLVRVVDALLRRCGQPVLVLLEDMHWAGTESLKLLAQLRALASELSLLVVASYRDDERPSLPDEVPSAERLVLERLGPDAIGELCTSILGREDDERARPLAELVARESEGNPFKALDVLRSLADDAGGLTHVYEVPLHELQRPARTRTGYRLVERLSDEDRSFLRVAALAGRELDLDVLRRMHPGLDVDGCAVRGVQAAVLSSVQGRFWFSHDKIRDALHEELADEPRREAHRRLAEAIHALTPTAVTRLVVHYGGAGDVAREKDLAARAGDQFLRSGAYHEAIPFLRRASKIATKSDPDLWRAKVERQLGEALFRSGQLQEARASLAAALATLGRPIPSTRARTAIAIANEVAVQVRLRARRRPLEKLSASEVERFEEAILAYTQLSRLGHHLNDEELVILVTLSALNLAERGALHAHLTRLAAVMGAVMGLVPVHRWARFYLALAETSRQEQNDTSIEAFVLSHRGYYEAGIGQWQECRADLERSRSLYESIGDIRLAEESISILAYALFYKGEISESLALYRTLERSGEERVDGQITSWGLANRIKVLVRSGDLARVEELIARAESLLVDGITRAVLDGVRVELALARGDYAHARIEALATLERLERSPPKSFMAVSSYAAVADALLSCLGAAKDDATRRALEGEAARANRALAKVARAFSIAEAARDVHAGTLEALLGRRAKAEALWRRALEIASARELPYDEALAAAALAMRERASRIFDRLGAAPARERVLGRGF